MGISIYRKFFFVLYFDLWLNSAYVFWRSVWNKGYFADQY